MTVTIGRRELLAALGVTIPAQLYIFADEVIE